MNGFVVFVVRQ